MDALDDLARDADELLSHPQRAAHHIATHAASAIDKFVAAVLAGMTVPPVPPVPSVLSPAGAPSNLETLLAEVDVMDDVSRVLHFAKNAAAAVGVYTGTVENDIAHTAGVAALDAAAQLRAFAQRCRIYKKLTAEANPDDNQLLTMASDLCGAKIIEIGTTAAKRSRAVGHLQLFGLFCRIHSELTLMDRLDFKGAELSRAECADACAKAGEACSAEIARLTARIANSVSGDTQAFG